MRSGWLLLMPLLAIAAAPAHATLIQLTWSGTITTSERPGVSVGDPASGSFLIETDSFDLDANPSRGEYPGALSDITFSFGSYSGTTAAASFVVRDGQDINTPDNFTMSAEALGPDLGGVPPGTFAFDLNDPSRTVFSGDAIPSTLDLGDFANRFALLTFFDGEDTFALQSSITSLSYAPIPEPGTAALVGFGVVALAAARRRR